MTLSGTTQNQSRFTLLMCHQVVSWVKVQSGRLFDLLLKLPIKKRDNFRKYLNVTFDFLLVCQFIKIKRT